MTPATPDTLDPDAVLAQWRAEEADARARLAEPGVCHPSQLTGRSGMDFFNGISSGELPYPHIGATLNFFPLRIEPGLAIFQGSPLRAHYNPLGTVHGGWFATLLDSAVACAIHSLLPAGRVYTTVELKLNMVRALTDKVPVVRAEGRVIHVGRSMGTAEGRLFGHDGKLYAHASTTCFIMDAAPER
jgi:uncharacterized protein (TIGR00369 family)